MGLLLLVVFFAKFEKFSGRVIAFLLICVLGFLLGIVGAVLPTFQPLAINLVGFPLLQIVLVAYISVVSTRSKQKKDAAKEGSA